LIDWLMPQNIQNIELHFLNSAQNMTEMFFGQNHRVAVYFLALIFGLLMDQMFKNKFVKFVFEFSWHKVTGPQSCKDILKASLNSEKFIYKLSSIQNLIVSVIGGCN